MKIQISYRLKCGENIILNENTEAFLIGDIIKYYENKVKVTISLNNNTFIRETADYNIFIKKDKFFIEYYDKKGKKNLYLDTTKINFIKNPGKLEISYIIKDSNEYYKYKIMWE